MLRRIATVLIASGLAAGTAFSQTRPSPLPQSSDESQNQVPVFRVTVVGRTTPAINYRPRRGDTRIDFAGTPLMPQAKGRATVSGEKGYIKVDARFDELQPPGRFGREYLTYVLWAITPEGRAANLGEVQYDDDDARVQVTTDLQAFGLVVTAEPYFAVTQPSDVVVLENVVREGTNGKVEAIQAKYELLKRGTYLLNHDPAQLKVKALEPGAPLDLAEARNAVEIARLAEADRFASDTFAKATRLLDEAERAREKRRGGNAVMMPARQAAQTAEDARIIALQKQEEAFAADQRARAQAREREALERARVEETRRRDEEVRRRDAELQAQAQETRRLQAELDAREKEAQRLKAEREAQIAAASSAAAERERAEALAARAAAEEARRSAEAARLDAERQAQQTQAQAEREKAELRRQLQEQLNVILETRETARGLIVNLSDVLFDTGSANLKPGAREKLARVSGIILSHPGLRMSVEGHTDSVGSDEYNQRLSERRAQSVHDYLVRNGIASTAVGTAGFGESRPVATNGTSAGRQQNRRVELVVTGEPIGR